MAKKHPSITAVLRDAVCDAGKPITVMAKESGISQSMLTRFVAGKSIDLRTAGKLAKYLGLSLKKD